MPHCDNCGKERNDTRILVLYSARILSLATRKLAPGSQSIVTTYDELLQQSFRVCSYCMRWDYARPFLTAIGAILFPAVAMIGMAALKWPTAVAVIVSVCLMLGGAIAMGHIGESWRIHKRILEPREKLDPKHSYRVFTEAEFKRLDIRIKPPV